jgi:hypothetical protein
VNERGSDVVAGGSASVRTGLVHAYLGFDAKEFPSPTAPPPDVAGAAFDSSAILRDSRMSNSRRRFGLMLRRYQVWGRVCNR